MDLGLNGKVAVVTGGSEGIGKATARSFGREGARVVVCARRADVLERAAQEVAEDTGAEIVPVPADMTNPADVERVIQTAVDRFGRLDVLVNNAGTSRALAFESSDDATWQADLDLKLFGAIRAIRAAVPHLRRHGGAIVNVLNIGSRAPGARSTPTSVSRAAGLALTKALSKEYGPDRIRVNAVLIGLVKSGQHEASWRRTSGGTLEDYYAEMLRRSSIPLGRLGEAEEPGDLIAFLCSDRARFITGTAINMDGGASPVI